MAQTRCSTLMELMAKGADEAVAIAAPGQTPLTYAGLRKLVVATTERLNGFGIGRNDRVGIVLPNGPDMATAFIAIGSASTAAPLNPAYRADEFEFYLSDLKAKALVIETGSTSPAISTTIALASPYGKRPASEPRPAMR